VVVVVTGAGTVVCSVVVVVECVGAGVDSQPANVARAAAARIGMMNLFMGFFFGMPVTIRPLAAARYGVLP